MKLSQAYLFIVGEFLSWMVASVQVHTLVLYKLDRSNYSQ